MSWNTDVTAYLTRVGSLPDTNGVSFEASSSPLSPPFYICEIFYVCIFILAFLSWLGWNQAALENGFWIAGAGDDYSYRHGLVSRIYISGRPPVTTLYSASIFIGWGVVFFSIAMELIYRNGIGLVAGSGAGFYYFQLLAAAGFAAGEGDTMKQLQAVLDTNIWLATHVVCVSQTTPASILAAELGHCLRPARNVLSVLRR